MNFRKGIILGCTFLGVVFAAGGISLAATAPLFTIGGKVLEKDGGEPVQMAYVVLLETGRWAATDKDGAFLIADVPAGVHTLEVTILGYETLKRKIEVSRDVKDLKLQLALSSLTLSEVVVTAREGGELTSASKISSQAIEHIQPSSLKDVMQLLPGGMSANPSLTGVNTLSIRDIGSNAANVAGTALILDGATVSNDANMQMLSSGTVMNEGESNVASTAGVGVDVRQVSTDNIESVEVIRGIPSVVYGDLTSGAVVVKTRAGASPWTVRLKTDPQLKQIAAGKGFALGKGGGALNFDLDYANAAGDVRTPSSAYQRVNFQAGWSGKFAGKLTMNARLRFNFSDAQDRSDPDLLLEEVNSSRETGVRLNINGRWTIGKPWITDVEYLLTGSVSSQNSRQRKYQGSAGYTPGTTAMRDGEFEGFFTSPQYYSDVMVEGLPIESQARITARQLGHYGDISNKVLAGAEWKMAGNRGAGKIFDAHCPPSPGSAAAYRERSYSDIPFLHRGTLFLEDNFKYKFWISSVELQAGARVSGIAASGIDTRNFLAVEPRLNLRYNIIQKNTGWRELSLRGGWGVSCKMPSMIHLYPEPAWKDMVSYSYNDFDASGYGLCVLTTQQQETANVSLRLQKSVNWEAGLEFNQGAVSGSVVYYDEDMTGGYGFCTMYAPMVYRRYGYVWENGAPSQRLLPSGHTPVYTGKGVENGGESLPYICDTTFMAFSVPSNCMDIHKRGVELTLEFPTIKAINTSISVSGAWQWMDIRNTGMSYRLYGGSQNGRSFPWVGIYAGSATTSNASLRERLNANVRFVTHIPSIAMVVTLTAQMVFIDRTTAQSVYNGYSQPYFYNEAGNRIRGAAALEDTGHTKYINPVSIMDRNGQIILFTQAMERDPAYRNLILSTNTASYYLTQGYSPYGMLNLRLTKEMKHATISFYANNFLNLKGRVKNSVTGYPADKNTPIYFGAEVKITL
ncbi:MAG: TonB-dependent receptor [Bacteroidales bacterium]|nr:TonB-dependent receptor [Bacteroidales bacterium]